MTEEINTPEETMNAVEKAELVAERIEKANEQTALLMRKQEELKAEKILSGESEAGKQQVEKANLVQDLSDKDYSEKVFKGEIDPFK